MGKGNTAKLESIYQKILVKAKSDPSFLAKLKKGDIEALEDIGAGNDEKKILESLKNEIANKPSYGKLDDNELEKVAGGSFLDELFKDIGKILKDVFPYRPCS